jgi:transcriptional regulator with XRE-family HTH domain
MLPLIDVAEQIAKRRRAIGLTQAELARMARVSRSTLDALENGRMGELGYAKVSNILTALGLEFTLQVAVSSRPTLDELMLENEREDAELRRSSRF